jgi:hypothetical protein
LKNEDYGLLRCDMPSELAIKLTHPCIISQKIRILDYTGEQTSKLANQKHFHRS